MKGQLSCQPAVAARLRLNFYGGKEIRTDAVPVGSLSVGEPDSGRRLVSDLSDTCQEEVLYYGFLFRDGLAPTSLAKLKG
jgi:hypothetical protein